MLPIRSHNSHPANSNYLNAWETFKRNLTGWEKAKSVVAMVFAGIAAFWAAGAGGVMAFFWCVQHYAKPIVPGTGDATVKKSNKVAKQNLAEARHRRREKALQLHEQIARLPGGRPEIDAGGNVISTKEQLLKAIELARKAFPRLMSEAKTDVQKIEVALLVQIILCGEEINKRLLPKTHFCFKLKELQHTDSFKVIKEYPKSFLYDAVLNTTSNKDQSSEQEHLKKNILECVAQFKEDLVKRGRGFTFVCGGEAIPMGIGSRECHDRLAFFKTLQEAYANYLRKHPEEQGRMSPQLFLKQSPQEVLQNMIDVMIDRTGVNKYFALPEGSTSFTLIQQDQEGLLEGRITPQGFVYRDDQMFASETQRTNVQETLEQWVSLSKFAKLCEQMRGDEADSIRIKIIEMILLLHQTNFADMVDPFQKIVPIGMLGGWSVEMRDQKFHFLDSEDPNRLLLIGQTRLTMIEDKFKEYGIEGSEDFLTVAVADTEKILYDYPLQGSRSEITPIKAIAFSWEVTGKILNHFIQKMRVR